MDPKPTGLNLSLNICNNPEGYTDQHQASTPEIHQLQLHHLPSSRHFPCRHQATNTSRASKAHRTVHHVATRSQGRTRKEIAADAVNRERKKKASPACHSLAACKER